MFVSVSPTIPLNITHPRNCVFKAMETAAAAPHREDIDTSVMPSEPQSLGTLPWITFGGSLGESPAAFVRSVQRLAFQQGRVDDDRWIAHYVSACFDGEALLWYSELEEEIQGSWRNVRLALLRRYLHVAGGQLGSSGAHVTPTIGTTIKTSGQVGLIGVAGNHGAPLGYIAFDTSAGATITLEEDQAFRVVLPRNQSTDVLQLYRAGDPADDKFPCLGLALFGGLSLNPDAVPEPLTGITKITDSRDRTYERNVPDPSAKCHGTSPHSRDRGGHIATWILAACGESRSATPYRRRSDTKTGKRAVAAAWRYDESTGELTIRWAMDDSSECELGAYLASKKPLSGIPTSKSEGLHFHRISDMDPANIGKYIQEDRVRFVFHPKP